MWSLRLPGHPQEGPKDLTRGCGEGLDARRLCCAGCKLQSLQTASDLLRAPGVWGEVQGETRSSGHSHPGTGLSATPGTVSMRSSCRLELPVPQTLTGDSPHPPPVCGLPDSPNTCDVQCQAVPGPAPQASSAPGWVSPPPAEQEPRGGVGVHVGWQAFSTPHAPAFPGLGPTMCLLSLAGVVQEVGSLGKLRPVEDKGPWGHPKACTASRSN